MASQPLMSWMEHLMWSPFSPLQRGNGLATFPPHRWHGLSLTFSPLQRGNGLATPHRPAERYGEYLFQSPPTGQWPRNCASQYAQTGAMKLSVPSNGAMASQRPMSVSSCCVASQLSVPSNGAMASQRP